MQNRKLIDYLPAFMQHVVEMNVILDVIEQPEIVKLWEAFDDAMNDQFIMDATENGVEKWEEILKITPKPTSTLDERKFTILTRLNEQLPYTMRTLDNSLKALCGENKYSIELTSNEYTLLVKLALIAKNNFNDVVNLLNRVLPANIIIKVQIMYNSHKKLSVYTHEKLRQSNHSNLRNEVLEIGYRNNEL